MICVVTTCTLGCVFLLLILVRCVRVMWCASWTSKVKQWRPYDHSRHPPSPPQPRPKTTHSTTSSTSTTTTSDHEDRSIIISFAVGLIRTSRSQTDLSVQ